MKNKYVVLTIIAAIIVSFGISFFKNPTPKQTRQNKNPTITYLSKDYFDNWREPNQNELNSIMPILAKNKTRECSNFYIIKVRSSEFVIACTSDNRSFNYYAVWTSINKIGLIGNDIITIHKIP